MQAGVRRGRGPGLGGRHRVDRDQRVGDDRGARHDLPVARGDSGAVVGVHGHRGVQRGRLAQPDPDGGPGAAAVLGAVVVDERGQRARGPPAVARRGRSAEPARHDQLLAQPVARRHRRIFSQRSSASWRSLLWSTIGCGVAGAGPPGDRPRLVQVAHRATSAQLGHPAADVVAVGVELAGPASTGLKTRKNGAASVPRAGHPLPAVLVGGQVAVDQVLHEVPARRAATPGAGP